MPCAAMPYRLTRFVSLALLACTLSSAAGAADMPKRKPGLWEIQMRMDNAPSMGPVQQCIDRDTDNLVQQDAKKNKNDCSVMDAKTSGNRVTVHSVCKMENSVATTDGVFEGNFETGYKGTLLIISHDRYFLDHVCTTMGEMLAGRLSKFTGNYTEYMKKRTADFEARMKAYQLQQKDIEREQAIIERYRSFNREKSIRAAESRQKRLDKIERLDRPVEESHVRFSFDVRRRMGEEALEVKNLAKTFGGKPVFTGVNFKLRAGDRVALIGPNGVGKSTLFKILMNRETPDKGSVRFGTNVDIGYYDQHQQELSPDNTVLDEVWNFFPTMEQSKVRGALGLFLFSGDDVFAKIGSLSGGERGRVALTKLMLRKDNLLLLDEPTNHLDMDSREVLEDALYDFPGTILAISHDRYFINRFADRVMVMNEDGMTEYLGNFDDYLEKRDRPTPPAEAAPEGATRTSVVKERKRDRQTSARLRELKAAVARAEAAIGDNERRIAELEARLAEPETYADQALLLSLTQEYQQEQSRQEALYDALEQAEAAWREAEDEA